ncbi:MAG: UDP-N-acetylmuramoyl-L-alanyl-D-glutamate--2,6-diaminopimelate ligase [Sedimentisphaerales bacterium]|nr:UDP-N-acetylmuramoyl-L-alanyl-D-glutamate--2,6-diaminopimelate ligase [Sedimentisphaerales bacterium]
MNFNELINFVSSGNSPNICTDSRAVKKGDVFVAVKGTVSDGHDFIGQAIANGAKYIVCEENIQSVGWGSTPPSIILVEDSTKAAAILAQASKGNPASKLINLAVTGTNGKTTTTYLVRSCIRQAGQKCGLIGTVIYDDCSGKSTDAPLTTPDCLTIAEIQAEMIKNGAKYMITEASSHALSQDRLAGINFKAAAFTNLTGDHLDYHKTKENYLEAKTRLFTSLAPDSIAVLNKESPEAKYIAEKTRAKILWYAIEHKADLVANIESMDISGTVFTLNYKGQSATVRSPLIGRYNVSNHLAAAGLCLAAGLDLKTIAAGLSALKLIPGRLEKVEWPCVMGFQPMNKQTEPPCFHENPFSVLIDYAHTDDALKNVLEILKPLCKGKLRVVFGCGGDRDRTKRPRMAHVVEQFADVIIVTSDNPRTEDPQKIIDEILTGFEKKTIPIPIPNPNIMVIPDRKQAIEMVIKAADKDDIILIAGKGHEDYQIIGKTKYHFSDKEIAQNCLKQI